MTSRRTSARCRRWYGGAPGLLVDAGQFVKWHTTRTDTHKKGNSSERIKELHCQ
jgi:hypothetical protein